MISIRFVDNGSPCEKLLAFHECQSGVSGEDDIPAKLVEWQLLRVNGAVVIAGKSNVVASRISSKHLKALYTRCTSHRQNLCVIKCCTIWEVSNMMQTVDVISRFFSESP